MLEFTVQRVRAHDWELVRSIRLRALAESPDAFSSTLAVEQAFSDHQWRRRTERDGAAHFIALLTNGDAIGIVVGDAYRAHKQTAGLFGMWVTPDARKQGVGAQLVEAVVEWAEREAYRRVILDVGDSNTPAIRLYESCGFVSTGRTGTLPPPREHLHELEMERILS